MASEHPAVVLGDPTLAGLPLPHLPGSQVWLGILLLGSMPALSCIRPLLSSMLGNVKSLPRHLMGFSVLLRPCYLPGTVRDVMRVSERTAATSLSWPIINLGIALWSGGPSPSLPLCKTHHLARVWGAAVSHLALGERKG